MNPKKLFLGIFVFFISSPLKAQDFNTNIDKQILILASTKNYEAAQKIAGEAAQKMSWEYRYEELKPNKEIGLTMSPKDCEDSGWDYPCYAARGQGGGFNTFYISVEYSGAYMGLQDGYYIVVASIDDKNSAVIKATLQLARKFYPDANLRDIKVWFGCMH